MLSLDAMHNHQKINVSTSEIRSSTFSEYEIIRILHKFEVLIEKSVPMVTVWHHEALPRGRFEFFLHTYGCRHLILIKFTINTFTNFDLTSFCDILVTSRLTTKLRDVHYNQCLGERAGHAFV